MDLDDPRWGVISVIFGVIGLVASLLIGIISLFATSNPVLQTIGVIVAIVALSSAAVLYFRLRKLKQITYKKVSDTTVLSVQVAKEIQSRVKILFDNKVVQDARTIILDISNSGNVPIPPKEFITPISIDFGINAIILDAEIVEVKPQNTNISFSLSLDGKLVLEPFFIEKNTRVRLKVLLTGFKGSINIFAQINGLKKIVDWYETPTYKLTSSTGFTMITILLLGCLFWMIPIGTGTITYFVISFILSFFSLTKDYITNLAGSLAAFVGFVTIIFEGANIEKLSEKFKVLKILSNQH